MCAMLLYEAHCSFKFQDLPTGSGCTKDIIFCMEVPDNLRGAAGK